MTDIGAFTPVPAVVRLAANGRTNEKPAFGSWLLLQSDQDGFPGQLAQAAKADRGFPKNGDAKAVRKRISAQGADPDMHEALDDAELEWASLMPLTLTYSRPLSAATPIIAYYTSAFYMAYLMIRSSACDGTHIYKALTKIF